MRAEDCNLTVNFLGPSQPILSVICLLYLMSHNEKNTWLNFIYGKLISYLNNTLLHVKNFP